LHEIFKALPIDVMHDNIVELALVAIIGHARDMLIMKVIENKRFALEALDQFLIVGMIDSHDLRRVHIICAQIASQVDRAKVPTPTLIDQSITPLEFAPNQRIRHMPDLPILMYSQEKQIIAMLYYTLQWRCFFTAILTDSPDCLMNIAGCLDSGNRIGTRNSIL